MPLYRRTTSVLGPTTAWDSQRKESDINERAHSVSWRLVCLVMPSRIIIIIIRAGELHLHFSLLDQKLVNRAADFSSAGCFLASSLETLGESFIPNITFINTHRGAIIVRKGCRRVLLSSSGGLLLSSSGDLLFLLALFIPPHPGWMPEFYWASCSGFLFFPVGFFVFCGDSEKIVHFFLLFLKILQC